MIIRPHCKKEYVALPNALFNDKRLSADTRLMIAVLLSKPRTWELRPVALAKLLSRQHGPSVGRARLSRMFAEATDAGYMARSQKQAHKDDGTWARYDYFIGMPDDVVRAVKKAGVAVEPQARGPRERRPYADNQHTNYKEQSLQTTESTNSSLCRVDSPQLRPPDGSMLGKRDRSTPTPLERQEVVQQRVAVRLGRGDACEGWLILGELPEGRRDMLTAMERSGRLQDHEVLAIRTSVLPGVAAGGHSHG